MNSCKSTDANEDIEESEPEEYSLSVRINPNEAGTVEPDSGSYQDGTQIEVTAKPNPGWSFVKWTGEKDSTDNPINLVMDQDQVLEAEFERIGYSLSIAIEGEGEIREEVLQTKSTNKEYEENTNVQLTAIPETGWKFFEWNGDVTGSENPKTIVMDSEKEVTAFFERKQYSFSSEVEGDGSISIELLSGEETENGYLYGSEIRLTAQANDGWLFKTWEADTTSSENPIELTISGDTQIKAVFQREGFDLTVETEGEGTVEESVVQPKTTNYPSETQVELTAVPEEGWAFHEWSGDLTGTDNPNTVLMDSDKTVTASFSRQEFELNLEEEGEGDISIELLSGEETENGYLYGSEIRLTANPADGWLFKTWEEDTTSSDNPIELTISGDTQIKAVFEREGYDLTVETEGEGTVEESVIQTKTTNYPSETLVELSAVPAEGWSFNEWSGDLTGVDNPNTVLIDSDKTVTAHFSRQEFELNIGKQGEGEISTALQSGTATENGYLYESVVELNAEADDHWYFSGWEGDIDTDENPTDIEIVRDLSIDAVFNPVSYPVDIQTDGEGTISTTLISGTEVENGYSFGSQVEIEALPSDGWTFIKWTGDIESTENPITINVEDEIELSAVFEKEYYDLNIEQEGEGTVNEELLSGDINSENQYVYESEVELTAEPAEGWIFKEWENDLSGNSNPETIVIDSNKSVTAIFEVMNLEYTVDLTFEDSKGAFDMQFGQASDPASLRRLAPPPPPAGALNAYFVYDGENYVRDFRSNSETDVTWELHYSPGDGENLMLTWDLNSSEIKGSLILTNDAEDFEINMLEEQSFDLPNEDEGVLKIVFEVDRGSF